MRNARAAIAADPRFFGRAPARPAEQPDQPRRVIPDDLWLFGSTFAAGFLFVSILIA